MKTKTNQTKPLGRVMWQFTSLTGECLLLESSNPFNAVGQPHLVLPMTDRAALLPYECIVSEKAVKQVDDLKAARVKGKSTFGNSKKRDMCDPFTGEPCTYAEFCESEIARLMEKDD